MRLYAQGKEALTLAGEDIPTTDFGKAEAYFKRGESLMGTSTVDPKTFKMVPASGCVEAFHSYLVIAPHGPHADKVKEYLADFGEK